MSQVSKHSKSIASNFIIRSELFFELFPFHIIFQKTLEIISIGDGLNQVMKIEGETLRDLFNINRPMIHAFTWENVILRLYK
jgi:guanylate cyclase